MWSNRISASQQHRRLMSTWCFGFDVNPIFISNWISNSSQQVGVDWFWRQADFQFVFQLKFECRLNIWCYLGGFPHCISLDAFFRSPHGLFTCTQPKPTQNVIVQNLVPCREYTRIKTLISATRVTTSVFRRVIAANQHTFDKPNETQFKLHAW